MLSNKLSPRLALNKAFLKVKPNRNEIELFKGNLITLLDRTNDRESEEFHKNLVSDFLKDTYYKQNHFINTKGRNDLVIHNGTNAASSVGVIIEAKKPTNKAEMVTPQKLNAKAFHELILYYLRERITHKNLEVKHLIITNINEWYIFDVVLFETLFAKNKKLVQQFQDFEAWRLAGTNTDFFYKEIAQPFVAALEGDIVFTYFNIQDYQKPLRNDDRKDDNMLIALFKLLSPEHLLKLPFTNDSNSLDKRFYSELLHIIGLTETKEGGKKIIERHKPEARNSGSLLEDAIIQLDSLDKLSRLERPGQFGANTQERLFNVALELSITWINRILFLKLLEAQLISYHKGDKSYAFLNMDKIKNFDDLNSLFFQVLARRHDERNADVVRIFEKVPYLNSSLFEPTDIEQVTLFISNLKDEKILPILSNTVLKDQQGKKMTGQITTLSYLFEFLNAYDFSSEGSEDIQEDNKTLINASVLGLIFEKINGYKDGSFFTPGFITMYMCRETIRKAVVQKFNESKGWQCEDIGQIYDQIGNSREARTEANDIVNAIKICDPAVGSGHFLVSALNEMISVKNDLRILQDREGQRLKEYSVEVVNDELIITDEEGGLFEYNPRSRESQRIMETLFHEKQRIIENCLFGVDINPNSVKICRLRLWIELLKNAYYKNATELETLPNIDINIKCGNSLVSRFAIDADLGQALKKSKWTIDSYRLAVDTYRNAESKEQKREMERLITSIKSDFRSEITKDDPKLKRLSKLNGELFNLTNQDSLFEMEKKQKALWTKQIEKLTSEIKRLDAEIEEIKANKIYENAFEWRFEFPEVLNDVGDFVGFDVVIGNPPYIRQEELKDYKTYFKSQFELYTGTADIYIFFIEKGFKIMKNKGVLSFILPNKFMQAGYGQPARKFLIGQNILEIIDFGDYQIFEEATTYPCILSGSKEKPSEIFYSTKIKSNNFFKGFSEYILQERSEFKQSKLSEDTWVISSSGD
ncbi:MAG: Eco57I restriction-modification methylase domain-containing protein, partial [Saprospiraceae bacterium]